MNENINSQEFIKITRMEINVFEDKLNTLIEHFIQKNRMRMFFGSAQMHDPIRLYLFKTLNLSDNFTLQIPCSLANDYLNFQVPKLLSLLETYCKKTNIIEINMPYNKHEHPWETILKDYVHSTLAYIENEADLVSMSTTLKDVVGIKILFSNKDFITNDIELTDDFIFFQLDVTHQIYVDNPYLRICFVKIFNFANSILWFLRFLCPQIIYINKEKTVENRILYSIATSLSIPVKHNQ